MNPCSRKGEIRAREVERLFEAHRRGEVRATAARASDYYGPGATLSHVGDQFWKPVIAGGRGRVLVNPDAIHTYHYVPDVAAGLATLGTAGDDTYGKPWMLPCPPAESLRALAARFSHYLGRDIELTVMPRWAMRGLGLLAPMIRELNEMLYQWEEPFVIDDHRFRTPSTQSRPHRSALQPIRSSGRKGTTLPRNSDRIRLVDNVGHQESRTGVRGQLLPLNGERQSRPLRRDKFRMCRHLGAIRFLIK